MVLSPGDLFILYTDGVTEAFDRNGNIFIGERFWEVLGRRTDDTVKRLVETVTHEIHRFSEGVEQSDDITLLTLGYRGWGGKP